MKTYQFPLPTGHPGTLHVPDDTPPKVLAGIMFGFHGFGILRQAAKAAASQMLESMGQDGEKATPENLQFATMIMAALQSATRIDSVETEAELESLMIAMTEVAHSAEKRVRELLRMAAELKEIDTGGEGTDPCPASAGT